VFEVGDMLQRMRQIAVQSASETYAASDRTALNLEWQALQEEIDRISSQSTWNGFQLLDGTPGASGKVKIQSGSNASQTVTVDFGALGGKVLDDDGANAIADATDELVTTVANGSFTAVITAALTNVAKKYVVTMANTASLQTGDVLTFTLQGNDKSTKHEVALTLSADNITKIKAGTAADKSVAVPALILVMLSALNVNATSCFVDLSLP
jgi:flagellin-like hook-associated protein FlgL